MSYNLCCEVGTSLNEAAFWKSKETIVLPVRSKCSQIVITVFWIDNCDVTMENDLGGRAVNMTHLIAFQEQANHEKHSLYVLVERIRKRKSCVLEDNEHIAFTLDIVAEPPCQTTVSNQDIIYHDISFQQAQFV